MGTLTLRLQIAYTDSKSLGQTNSSRDIEMFPEYDVRAFSLSNIIIIVACVVSPVHIRGSIILVLPGWNMHLFAVFA